MNPKDQHTAECMCADCIFIKGTIEPAEPDEKCGRCNAPLRVKENDGNMCQGCLNRVFR